MATLRNARRQADVTVRSLAALDVGYATDLAAALRQATATVARALRITEPPPPPSTWHRRWRRPRATRCARPWSVELVRLTDIGVWLRRSTLEDPGVRVPTTVRVGSRAANGPHIAGMVFEPDDLVAPTLREPRIGVDLQAIIERAGTRSAATPAETAAVPALPRAS